MSPIRLVTAMACAWAPFLFFQLGELADEAEHLHVAWMMGALGKQPLDDFFQHHQPLLWDLLKSYYLLGGEGPGVFYFGRGLVVAATMLSVFGLSHGVSRWGPRGGVAAVAAMAYWILVNLALSEGLVIRPETIGMAALALAFSLWMHAAARPIGAAAFDLSAGLLCGAALLASPRLALSMGLFVLAHRREDKLLELRVVRLGALFGGVLLAWLGYLAITPHRLGDFWFNFRFSAHLQSVGDGDPRIVVPLAVVLVGSLIVLGALASRLSGLARLRLLVGIAYLIVTAAISTETAGGFLYSQAFLGTWLLGASLVGLGVANLRLGGAASLRLATGVAGLVILSTLGLAASQFSRGLPLRGVVSWRVELSRILGPEDRVLLPAGLHPVDREDASYYGPPLVDAEDRLCRAVRTFAADLPACDYAEDLLRERPAATFSGLLKQVDPARRTEVLLLLQQEYVLAQPLLLRRDTLSRVVQ
ncbi:MAG TPA: hypothetical protein VMV46_21640 [Thermoanaerobaculia bacterium]|nr:hypothetical protein [Thermoanaerobaculia bacterium]